MPPAHIQTAATESEFRTRMKPKPPPTLPLRIGLVGGGAIAEHGYLPAARGSKVASIAVLIDRDPERATKLAHAAGVGRVGTTLAEAVDHIDAAILATPNHLHAPMAVELLERGIPVLVEKPMALHTAECQAMLDASRAAHTSLTSGFVSRFSRAARLAKSLLESGMLGPVRSFQAENGCEFAWPVASDYLFRRESAGGGVLMDLGPHVLDLLAWWLGPVAGLSHFDDSFGGVEAESLTHLQMETGARGTVRLSRTCRLRQSIVLECEHADLCIALDQPKLHLRPQGSALHLAGLAEECSPSAAVSQTFVDLLRCQMDHWATSLAQGLEPEPNGEAGLRIVALIEQCYAERQPWRMPWHEMPPPSSPY
jgi:predicted dehydrogenase